MHPLIAALLALGPHAAEALAHAHDAPAAWVSMRALSMRATAAAMPTKRVYGYLPYWENMYNWHWSTGPSAGAVAPLASVQDAVDGYLVGAPPDSIAMGVPYYGYEWPTSSASAGAATTGAGSAVLFESAFANFSAYGRIWDVAAQSPWYGFAVGGQTRQGWVEDGESLALKYRFARSRDLAGVMIWALGYDGTRSEAWTALESSFLSGSGNGPPPAVPAQGCSQAGAAPGWLLLLALLGRRRSGPYPGVHARKSSWFRRSTAWRR